MGNKGNSECKCKQGKQKERHGGKMPRKMRNEKWQLNESEVIRARRWRVSPSRCLVRKGAILRPKQNGSQT